ncbi:MAG: hypothetical protein JWM80_2795 [Cyanobacteria bacterium RYN_339]|nr:hypothetical protein [Cyanobacteria bacterium RYN_339]
MVKGLDIFKDHFAGHEDKYILIGGTASGMALEGADLAFRATKDLDIVLVVEALDVAFGAAFWTFIKAGGYEIRQIADTGKPMFYRFQKPTDERYPAMLELFSRAPDGLTPDPESHLTPLPIDEAVSSLSAILLDKAYYEFIVAGRRVVDGLGLVAEDRLIPLKASAWLDLTRRQKAGAELDSKTIRKHANDVVRLSQLLTPASSIPLPPAIAADLKAFLADIEKEGTLDPGGLGVKNTLPEVLKRIAAAYQLDQGA